MAVSGTVDLATPFSLVPHPAHAHATLTSHIQAVFPVYRVERPAQDSAVTDIGLLDSPKYYETAEISAHSCTLRNIIR
jgi:hypothetical protein